MPAPMVSNGKGSHFLMVTNELQDIADQMYFYYEKKEKFGLFLGLIKKRGKFWAYEKLSEMRDYLRTKGKKYPITLLMYNKKYDKRI